MCKTDMLNITVVFKLIQSISSSKAEPFKVWLANLGSEWIDKILELEIAIKRAIDYYHKREYFEKWIEKD